MNRHFSMETKLKGRQIILSGIAALSPPWLRKLNKKGLETAWDISEEALRRVPELENPLIRELLLWKRRCEKEVYNGASTLVQEASERGNFGLLNRISICNSKKLKGNLRQRPRDSPNSRSKFANGAMFQTQAEELLIAYNELQPICGNWVRT